ncbi:MAG: hypothetical protein IJ087_13225 [Eggerthellaceae bacterium]|nr:hypothetical protein [Eggerthellaceae bacterium]
MASPLIERQVENAVRVTTCVVGFAVSRKSEELRIERVMRRVLDEERQKGEAQA